MARRHSQRGTFPCDLGSTSDRSRMDDP
jgi:hypothetical protein